MTYCQSITQTLRIIWIWCILLSLRSKTRRRATPLLLSWIYSCRSSVTVSCALPFTTDVTIPTSISQTPRTGICHGTFEIVHQEVLWSIWGSHQYYEVSLSQMLHDILGHDHIQCHPQLIRLYTNLRTYYQNWLYYRFLPLYYQILEVSIEHCNGCGYSTEDAFSSGHLILSHVF